MKIPNEQLIPGCVVKYAGNLMPVMDVDVKSFILFAGVVITFASGQQVLVPAKGKAEVVD